MDKGKQLIIALLCEFDKGHELYNGLDPDSDEATDLVAATPALTKADLFGSLPGGKSIFEYRQVWKHVDRLVASIRQNGEDIAAKDFLRKLSRGKSVLQFAEDFGALHQLFSVPLWQGRREEMEHLWYNVHPNYRTKHDGLTLRRKIAAAEGVKLREDRLEELGISLTEIRKAFFTGDFAFVNARLHPAGDHLRKEDAFLPGDVGESAFHAGMAWNNLDKTVAELARHGEYFTKNDFLKVRGENEALLDKAIKFDDLPRLFSPALWMGRPHEMLELFNLLSPAFRKTVHIHDVTAQVADGAYGGAVNYAPAALTKNSLLEPLRNAARDPGNTPHQFVALGLPSVWNRMADVQAVLAARGEKITLADMRTPCGYGDENILRMAVRFGHLAAVQSILAQNGERIEKSDLLHKSDAAGEKSILELIVQKNQIPLLFTPENWAGRAQDMLDVFNTLPDSARRDMDIGRLLGDVNRLSLRRKFLSPRP